MRAQVVEFCAAAEQLGRDLADALLRPIARAIAVRVRADAKQRVASGELEFHDLLVASRDLLRHSSEARAALQHTYQRILLDEFQDTDPIQIELAVRIAGGAGAEAEDWHEIVVPADRCSSWGSETVHLSLPTRQHRDLPRCWQAPWSPRVADHELPDDVARARLGQPRLRSDHCRGRRQAANYEALDPYRDDVVSYVGPAVTVLGAEPHEKGTKVDALRVAEAADAASVITTALTEGGPCRIGTPSCGAPSERATSRSCSPRGPRSGSSKPL